jgi:hypothetical protein
MVWSINSADTLVGSPGLAPSRSFMPRGAERSWAGLLKDLAAGRMDTNCGDEALCSSRHLQFAAPCPARLRLASFIAKAPIMRQPVPRISKSFDPQAVEWRRVTDPDYKDYKIDFEYSLLGYDLESGRLDMLLRDAKGRGHCRRHRHVASTLTGAGG